MMLANRVFDKGAAGPANMWFDRRDIFAFPGVEDGKGERFCPYPDRRRRIVSKVFKLDFRHGRKLGIVFPSSNKGAGTGFDPAEESGGSVRLPEVDGEAVEIEKGLLEGVNVVLVVDVRVELRGPFQGGGGRFGGGKVDERKGDAVEVESGGEELVELLDGERAIEMSGMGLLGGHCGLGERDAHQHHLDQQRTLSRPGVECVASASGWRGRGCSGR